MPAPIANIAIDGKTGPGITFNLVSDTPINGARSMNMEFANNIIRIVRADGRISEIDMTGITTMTVAISGGVYTVTIV